MTKFTREELVNIFKAINEFVKDKKYNKYVLFALDKNKKRLLNTVNSVIKKEQDMFTEEYKKYDSERLIIVNKYSAKAEDGTNVKDSNGNAIIPQDSISSFNDEIKELRETYKDAIKVFDEDYSKYVDYLKEPIEISLYPLDFKYFPDELDGTQYSLLSLFIKDEEDEAE